MQKIWSLIAISLPMLILQGFKSQSVLADYLSISEPTLTVQVTETKTAEITIEPPLTAEQETTLQEINAKYQPQIEAAAQEYIGSLEVIDSLLGTNPTNETIRDSYSQAQNNRNKLGNLLLERLLEFRSVLTPEQQASISDDIRSYLESKPEQQ